jgi:hypothetical protein
MFSRRRGQLVSGASMMITYAIDMVQVVLRAHAGLVLYMVPNARTLPVGPGLPYSEAYFVLIAKLSSA